MPLHNRLKHIAADAGLEFADVQFGGPASAELFQYSRGASDAESTERRARRYLIASITKPIVAMAGLKLAAEGAFSLVDRIGSLLPEFRKAAYRRVTVRHLLTHTSGFPDMLPDNAELRAAHAPLSEFLKRAAQTDLDFQTASDARYSSVGFLILSAIIESVTTIPLPKFLQDEFYTPLGMEDTWLGIPREQAPELMPTVLPSLLPDWQPDADDWGWNSAYWRTLGAPWGGMMSTAPDLGRFATMMLSDGCSSAGREILPSAVVRAAMSNQTQHIVTIPGSAALQRPWGFGWRWQWPDHQASFGDFLSPGAVGHWGATGTTIWIDPATERYAVILTTTPYEDSQSAIQRMSNVVSV